MVFEDGKVIAWTSIMTVKLSCVFHVGFFPFDSQICDIKMSPWAWDRNQYNLSINDQYLGPVINQSAPLKLSYYVPHEQWAISDKVYMREIEDWNHPSAGNMSMIRVDVPLRRRSLFFGVFLIYPNLLLYFLSIFTYLLPPESGEKVSFAVTLLLAEVVNFGTMLAIFPTSSLHIPIVVYFACAVSGQMMLMCIFAISEMPRLRNKYHRLKRYPVMKQIRPKSIKFMEHPKQIIHKHINSCQYIL
ncbi:acetylcholine receptor subunit beta-type acr-3-like isoform X2 [Convolutriloba macropyga]|uniref:acetylcholine receptor subunit beta-type acr-3-like isoform X2 n=1 Tax=Convolutriloba macropyga TaxID=536237 RepID=UPI003F51CF7C